MKKKDKIEKYSETREFRFGVFMLQIKANIIELMAQKKIKRKELAIRLNRNKSYVTQILSPDANLTLKTIHSIYDALNELPSIEIRTAFETTSLKALYKNNLLNIAGIEKAKPIIEEKRIAQKFPRKDAILPLANTDFAKLYKRGH